MKTFFSAALALIVFTSAFAQNSITDLSVVSSFCQGSANNCASVALIKAAMYKYGYNKIFKYEFSDNKYKIELKDETKLNISPEELTLATTYSNFDTTDSYKLLGSLKDSVLFYSYLSYACIAKYIQENGYWACSDAQGNSSHIRRIRGFQSALSFITRTSYCTDNCHRLLGLKIKENKIYDYDGSAALNDKGTILYSWGHAVAVYENQLDCHGEWLPVSTNKVCYNRFKWFITLE